MNTFGIRPRIDVRKSLEGIEEDLIKLKKTKQWLDEDDQTRFTNLRFISKETLVDMSEDFNEGLAYINMAKKYKLSFNRIKGLDKFMRKL